MLVIEYSENKLMLHALGGAASIGGGLWLAGLEDGFSRGGLTGLFLAGFGVWLIGKMLLIWLRSAPALVIDGDVMRVTGPLGTRETRFDHILSVQRVYMERRVGFGLFGLFNTRSGYTLTIKVMTPSGGARTHRLVEVLLKLNDAQKEALPLLLDAYRHGLNPSPVDMGFGNRVVQPVRIMRAAQPAPVAATPSPTMPRRAGGFGRKGL